MPNSDWPAISVVMPLRNEAPYVERSVGAMLAQDYPGQIEVVCVDGMSTDRTREIIRGMASHDPRVRLVDNPKLIQAAALNLGIHEARYDLVARMDGHTCAPVSYLRQCVEVMQMIKADCVGGRWEYDGEAAVARAIGAAMASAFGAGTAYWRQAIEPGEVDTVPFGIWQKETLLALGGFDETLVCNEDYEFNYRLRAAGGRIYYSPDIVTTYYSRQNLRALARQYFRYGFWKARVLQMHPASFRLRHLVAPVFVGGLVAGAALAVVWPLVRAVYGAALITYALLALLFSARQAAKYGWQYFPLLPLIFLILHLSWGTGFWAGVWHWWVRRMDQHDRQQ